jgi:tetratricopeptide (TPR) repeat protein
MNRILACVLGTMPLVAISVSLASGVASAAASNGAPPAVARAAELAPAALALVVQANGALAEGRLEDAISRLERARDLAPTNVPLLLKLAGAHGLRVNEVSMLGKLPLARKIHATLQSAVDAEPKNPRALFAMYQFHTQAPSIAGGSSAEADRLAREISALDPALAHTIAASRAAASGNQDLVARELRAAAALRPDDPRFALDLVVNAQARKDWDEAFAVAQKAAAAGDRFALFQVGRTGALGGGRLAEAEAALRSYLAGPFGARDPLDAGIEPPKDAAWARLGQVIARDPARKADAREAFSQALALNPKNEIAKKALADLR